ncbi:MAG: hypothetical protein GEU80_00040 [Dehalococcoidia bacterium]|nr:hypothetical protein [Dehalococcoidia bacterium]
MGVALTKDSIDIGIIVEDAEQSLRFYRDTLGFEFERVQPMANGGQMHRLLCGTSTIKVIQPGSPPPAKAPPGGLQGAYGYRYWTFWVSNLDEMVERCRAAGYTIAVEPRESRPGVTISMVEDPDGNWVELGQQA